MMPRRPRLGKETYFLEALLGDTITTIERVRFSFGAVWCRRRRRPHGPWSMTMTKS